MKKKIIFRNLIDLVKNPNYYYKLFGEEKFNPSNILLETVSIQCYKNNFKIIRVEFLSNQFPKTFPKRWNRRRQESDKMIFGLHFKTNDNVVIRFDSMPCLVDLNIVEEDGVTTFNFEKGFPIIKVISNHVLLSKLKDIHNKESNHY